MGLLTLVLFSYEVFVATAQMYLKAIGQKASSAVMARHESLFVVLFIGIVVVFINIVTSIVFLCSNKHFIEVFRGFWDRSPIFLGLFVFLGLPFLDACLQVDIYRCCSILSPTK